MNHLTPRHHNETAQAPVSESLFERAQHVMPGGYTRDLVALNPHPNYAIAAQGSWITDADGRRRIDWVNNFAALIHGHAHPAIVETITTQAARLLSATMPTEWDIALAELLCARIPSLQRVRFANSGSEANAIAIKAARAFTGKPKIAKMEGGYHGQFDLLEASFQPRPEAWGPAHAPRAVAHNAGTPQSLLDEVVVLPLNDIEAARAIIRAQADHLAAVILDPWRLQQAMIEPDRDFVAMLREETARLGIVLIFDEVWSLRSGYHGTQGELGITPDMTTMGKIIGGGLAVGGVGGSARIMAVFDFAAGAGKVKHSGTFTANPLTMAAGYTSMSLLTPAVFADLHDRCRRLREGLERIRVDLRLEATVTGSGSLAALLPTTLPLRNYRDLYAAQEAGLGARLERLAAYLLDEGLLTTRGSFLASTAMTDAEIDFTLVGTRAAFVRLLAS